MWMDTVRGVAIILVIGYHSTSILTRFVDHVPTALTAAGDVFSPFRMPILMLLSGMLLHRSLVKPPRQYFGGKFRSILWPYLLWSFLFLVVSAQLTIGSAVRVILVPPTYLWYLWFLFVYFVASWFIDRLRLSFLPVAALSMVLAAVVPEDHRISRFFFLFAFFALGHWVSSRQVFGGLARPWRVLVATCCAALIVVGAVLSIIEPQAIRYHAAAVWAPLAAVALILLIERFIPTGPIARPIVFVGQNSMVFYVVHFPVIWIVDWWLRQLDVVNPWVYFVLGVGAACASGYALVRAEEKWGVVRALFSWPTARPATVSK